MADEIGVAPPLRCRCGGPLGPWSAGRRCPTCDARVDVDDLGIVRLSRRDVPWSALPASLRDAVHGAVTPEDLIARMLSDEHPWPHHLQRELLHPAGGVAATVVPLQPGANVLDLGTGWGTLGSALRSYGTTVTSADWVHARLRFELLSNDGASAQAVHLTPSEALPWADGSFDVVFVDLATLDDALAPRRRARRRDRRQVLAEVRRILADDGVAVIGTSNPLHAWRGRTHRSRQGRSPAPAQLWEALRRPWGATDLQAAGLRHLRVLVPYPRRAGWRWLVPVERLAEQLRRDGRTGGVGARLEQVALAVGRAPLAVPEFLVLARASAAAGPPRTLAEALPELAGDRPPVTLALSDARVAVAGTDTFLKLPLSEDQQHMLVSEVRNLELARGTAFAPFVLPAGRTGRWHTIPYGAYPRIEERPANRGEIDAAVTAALGSLDDGKRAPLASTTFWERLRSDRGRSDAAELGAVALRDAVLGRCATAVVPVGPTHGDLHAGNVMLPRHGGPLLVDWNRFELRNPLVLDAAYAAVEAHRAATGATLARGLEAFADGTLRGPVADRARALLGDLGPEQAAAVVLLDRITSYSRPRRRYKPWTMPRFAAAARALTARLDRW